MLHLPGGQSAYPEVTPPESCSSCGYKGSFKVVHEQWAWGGKRNSVGFPIYWESWHECPTCKNVEIEFDELPTQNGSVE
jgi:hypothetical protein